VSSRGRRLGVDCANAFVMALDSSLTHASIATSFGRSGLDESPDSSQVSNLDQSVLLNSGRSRGLRKDDRYRVSIITVKWSKLICGARGQIHWGDVVFCDDNF
jgi:hypothetical protein